MTAWPAPNSLVPHTGTMCLLDRVVAADNDSIACVTSQHRSPNNPLRRDQRLSALHLAEFGAQAMAAHGGLRQPEGIATRAGMLVSIRQLELRVDRLDDVANDLLITARRRLAQPTGLIYDFEVSAGPQLLGRGRVQVLFPH